jgi:hypothetical protein
MDYKRLDNNDGRQTTKANWTKAQER